MQFHLDTTDVKRSNVGAETLFRFKSSAKMFKIIVDGLYKNKIGSAVREIACNCYDSHVAAGTPERPFEIHMPDEYEPYITFKDYGVGLDDTEVTEILTLVGESTKENSDDQIGAFGLGSKTPFAYTDSFTVCAVKNGMKRTYAAFFNEDGIPAVGLMDERETEEPNGFEVTIPVVDARDFPKFRKEVREQLTFFPVKPILTNNDANPITFKNFKAGQQNYLDVDGITIGDTSNYEVRGVWAVQGVVGYQVDLDLIKPNLSPENQAFLDIIAASCMINFKLGDLEVIASREGISYVDRTFKAFAARLDAGRAALHRSISKEFDSLKGPWNKAEALNTNHTLARLANVAKLRLEDPYYYRTTNGYFIDLLRLVQEKPATGAVEVENDEPVNDDKALLNVGLYFHQYNSETVRKVLRWKAQGTGKYAKADRRFQIVFRDTSEKPEVRIREWASQYGRDASLFVVENKDGSLVTAEQKAEILKRIGEGFANYESLANVALPDVESYSGSRAPGYKPPTAYTWSEGCDRNSTREWERESLKLKEWTEGGYYCIVDRCNVTEFSGKCTVVTKMATAGLLDRPVVAIRRKDADKLDANLWIPVEKKADELIAEMTTSANHRHGYALSQVRTNVFGFIDEGVRDILKDAMQAGRIDSRSPLSKVFRLNTAIERLKARAENRGYNSIVAQAFTYADTDSIADVNGLVTEKVAAMKVEVSTRYPLLGSVRSGYDYNDKGHAMRVLAPELAEHVIQYVAMFDAAP